MNSDFALNHGPADQCGSARCGISKAAHMTFSKPASCPCLAMRCMPYGSSVLMTATGTCAYSQRICGKRTMAENGLLTIGYPFTAATERARVPAGPRPPGIRRASRSKLSKTLSMAALNASNSAMARLKASSLFPSACMHSRRTVSWGTPQGFGYAKPCLSAQRFVAKKMQPTGCASFHATRSAKFLIPPPCRCERYALIAS